MLTAKYLLVRELFPARMVASVVATEEEILRQAWALRKQFPSQGRM